MTTSEAARNLNRAVSRAIRGFEPPSSLTLSEWADAHRRLSPESSAEPGPWRTDRTPYLREVMDSFTDPRVRRIVLVASSQVGKSEFQLNALGMVIHEDPGSVLYILPTLDEARKFSRFRIQNMIRDCPVLRDRVRDVRQGRDNTSTVLQKSFTGGMLTIAGSNSAPALASQPIRYVIGDERDRWAKSAGDEGDPWELAMARQRTFYNAKAIEVSTPTVKGASPIAESYEEGTRERWMHRCPHCGEWHEVVFEDVHFDKEIRGTKGGRPHKVVVGDPWYVCPDCGSVSSEAEMRRTEQRWVAEDPDALAERHVRSFWLTAFASPWTTWKSICQAFLDALDDPQRLQVVYNTLFGKLWEDRGDLETEDDLMDRREDYGTLPDGRPVEVPDGALVLTMGVDTQGDRLEYEVVGHNRWGETWGVERGVIWGRPDEPGTWARLDDVIDRPRLRADGRTMRVAMTCVDSGGNYTQDVYEATRARGSRGVVAIKGKGGDGVDYISLPTKVPIRNKRYRAWLYTIGVDSGKAKIMADLKVQEPGPKYCHFPLREEARYDREWFEGLLSERLVLSVNSRRNRWTWEVIPGHRRNEPLDCRNYALAAVRILNPPWDRLEREARSAPEPREAPSRPVRRRRRSKSPLDDW